VGSVASPLADGSIAVQASAPPLARPPAYATRLVGTLALPSFFAVRQGLTNAPSEGSNKFFHVADKSAVALAKEEALPLWSKLQESPKRPNAKASGYKLRKSKA